MRKAAGFSRLYDVRALRVIVPEVKDCYAALGVVHNLWQPIPKEFDDYISRPKGNPLPVTAHRGGWPGRQDGGGADPHRGDAPPGRVRRRGHWQYKAKPSQQFDQKVAWLRQLLAWRDEVPVRGREGDLADDTIYVLTPQGKVIDLPAGSTPIDFAYALHSDLGHRCRGARRRAHRQARHAARERPARRDRGREERRPVARLAQPRARLREERARAQDPAVVQRQGARRDGGCRPRRGREGAAPRGRYAGEPGGPRGEARFRQARRAFRRGRARRGQSEAAADRLEGAAPAAPEVKKARKAPSAKAAMLVVGMGGLATQLARCCKPVPPDSIRGFVTREQGVSIHRDSCDSLKRLAEQHPGARSRPRGARGRPTRSTWW